MKDVTDPSLDPYAELYGLYIVIGEAFTRDFSSEHSLFYVSTYCMYSWRPEMQDTVIETPTVRKLQTAC